MRGKTAFAAALVAAALSQAWAAPAAATTTGDGAAVGSVVYNYPNDFIQPCDPLQWRIGGTLASVNLLIPSNEVGGTGSISGSGSTSCYLDSIDTGSVALSTSLTSDPNQGSFLCPSMSGSYVRSGEILSISVSGTCSINGLSIPGVKLSLSAVMSGADNAFNTTFYAGAVSFST